MPMTSSVTLARGIRAPRIRRRLGRLDHGYDRRVTDAVEKLLKQIGDRRREPGYPAFQRRLARRLAEDREVLERLDGKLPPGSGPRPAP
jgi:hypothetical protein